MVLPLLALVPAALSIAEAVAPQLGKWIAGDGGEDVARKVVGIAQQVTGREDPAAAKAALQADPALVIQFQQHMRDVELALYQAESARLDIVNRSLQAEIVSGDAYVRRWRPTMGYALTFTWVVTMIGIMAAMVYAAVATPQWAGEIIGAVSTAIGAMTVMWSVALAVLGVGVTSRSKDKRIAAGQQPLGIVEALASRLARPAQ